MSGGRVCGMISYLPILLWFADPDIYGVTVINRSASTIWGLFSSHLRIILMVNSGLFLVLCVGVGRGINWFVGEVATDGGVAGLGLWVQDGGFGVWVMATMVRRQPRALVVGEQLRSCGSPPVAEHQEI